MLTPAKDDNAAMRALYPRAFARISDDCYKDIMIRKYETTNDRGMEEVPEMWKDRKPDESRAQPLMRNGIVQMGTLDIWISPFREAYFQYSQQH